MIHGHVVMVQILDHDSWSFFFPVMSSYSYQGLWIRIWHIIYCKENVGGLAVTCDRHPVKTLVSPGKMLITTCNTLLLDVSASGWSPCSESRDLNRASLRWEMNVFFVMAFLQVRHNIPPLQIMIICWAVCKNTFDVRPESSLCLIIVAHPTCSKYGWRSSNCQLLVSLNARSPHFTRLLIFGWVCP